MENVFYKPEAREELARSLRELGFYVHLHSYEYLIMKNGKIVATIYLHPRVNEIVINVNKYNPKAKDYINSLVKTIRSIDKGENKILMREVPEHEM